MSSEVKSVQVEFLAEKEGETCVVCRSRTEALYITSGNGTLTLFAGKIKKNSKALGWDFNKAVEIIDKHNARNGCIKLYI